MATSSQIADLTCCAICLETFTRPKVLPCQHTYCYSCLLSLGDEEAKTITCPQCREVNEFPKDGIAGFKDNIIVNNLLGMCGPKEEALCADCKLQPAVSPCEHCNANMCVTCIVQHVKLALELKLSLNEAKESMFTPKSAEKRDKMTKAKSKCCDQLEELNTVQKRKFVHDFLQSTSSLEHFKDTIVRIHGDILRSSGEKPPENSYFSSLSHRTNECTTTDSLKELKNDVSDLKSIACLLNSEDEGFEFVPKADQQLGSIKIGRTVVEVQGNYGGEITDEQVTELLSALESKKLEKIVDANWNNSQAFLPRNDTEMAAPELEGPEPIPENRAILREERSSKTESSSSSSRCSAGNLDTISQASSAKPSVSEPKSTPRSTPAIPTPAPVQVYCQNQLPRNVDYHSKGKGWIPIIGQGKNAEKSKRLSQPSGIAYHVATDDIYVADFGNDRIMVYKSDGSNARVFYDVTSPQDIAISTDGAYVYIAAAAGGLVKVNMNGERVKTIRRSSIGKLTNSVAVACHEEYTVLVDNDRVFIYNASDWNIRHFGGNRSSDLYTEFIAISENGTMYLTDNNSLCDVKVFKWNGQYTGTYFSSENHTVNQVAIDADGYVCVANYCEDCIEVYDPMKKRVAVIGGPGKRPGRLNNPSALCYMPDGRIIVADYSNNRLQIF